MYVTIVFSSSSTRFILLAHNLLHCLLGLRPSRSMQVRDPRQARKPRLWAQSGAASRPAGQGGRQAASPPGCTPT
eukprot:scaffold7055_cov18-Prasinocladus_malaysianus.AAC.1